MTTLTKAVRRECCRTYDAHRAVVVTLEPGDVVSFRLKGTRRSYTTTLGACYSLAVKQYVAAMRREKAEARKARR